jgi:transcriptional regulator with XRE-family HTH domain
MLVTSSLVGRALGALRARNDRPAASVCAAVKLSREELVAIESGHSKPSIVVLDRIARVLGSTLVEVIRHAKPLLDATGQDGAAVVGLADIGRAIAELPAKGGSKVRLATSAAVLHALEVTGGNQSAAARLLGMERKAFIRRLAGARRAGRTTSL